MCVVLLWISFVSVHESVRSAILAVFQQSRAHVAQVNDPSKVCMCLYVLHSH